MRRSTVLLITSDECGWSDVRAAIPATEQVDVIEASDLGHAARLATTLQPDVIIGAAEVDGASIRPLLVKLGQRCPASKLVVCAGHLDPVLFSTASGVSMSGYLVWSDLTIEVLRHCLQAIISGDVVIGSRSVAQAFLRSQSRSNNQAPPLSPREQAVLNGLAAGKSRKEIAAAAGLSLRTVERLVEGLEAEAKLDAPTSFVLGKKATELGLVD